MDVRSTCVPLFARRADAAKTPQSCGTERLVGYWRFWALSRLTCIEVTDMAAPGQAVLGVDRTPQCVVARSAREGSLDRIAE